MKRPVDDLGITGNNAYLFTAVVIIIMIFASVALVMLNRDNGLPSGDLSFSISMDGSHFEKDEAIVVSMALTNNMDEAVNVTEYIYYGTVFIHLYDSTGAQIELPPFPVTLGIPTRITIQPGTSYTESLNITDYYNDFKIAQYSFNMSYVNYLDNATYLSNTLSFSIGWPENYPALVAFEPDGPSLFCEVADSPTERAEGLMYRTSLEEDRGMLFIFDNPLVATFWMKNTLIPLDMVFIDEDGYVTNVAQADPEPGVADADLTRYTSSAPVLYVLEMNQGIAVANDIQSGTYVNITYKP